MPSAISMPPSHHMLAPPGSNKAPSAPLSACCPRSHAPQPQHTRIACAAAFWVRISLCAARRPKRFKAKPSLSPSLPPPTQHANPFACPSSHPTPFLVADEKEIPLCRASKGPGRRRFLSPSFFASVQLGSLSPRRPEPSPPPRAVRAHTHTTLSPCSVSFGGARSSSLRGLLCWRRRRVALALGGGRLEARSIAVPKIAPISSVHFKC